VICTSDTSDIFDTSDRYDTSDYTSDRYDTSDVTSDRSFMIQVIDIDTSDWYK